VADTPPHNYKKIRITVKTPETTITTKNEEEIRKVQIIGEDTNGRTVGMDVMGGNVDIYKDINKTNECKIFDIKNDTLNDDFTLI
jgi:hypothetical protein